MKISIKLLVSLILVLSLLTVTATTFFAETIFTSGDFSYTLMNDNYISLYDWEGGSDTLTIPNSLDYYYVREIRNRCFINRNDFTSLDLEKANYLNRIGLNAFKGSALSGELSVPAQIKTVASGAFENCDSIEVLYYNAMAPVVSSQCFYDCDSLREVYLTDGVTTIENHAFSSCDSLTIFRIPDTVTSISSVAFEDCPNLVIYCYTDSAAHQFAESNGIEYVLIDAPEPTEPVTEPTEAPTEPVTETPEPTEAVTEQPTEAVRLLLGDADGDGMVDVTDATVIQRVLNYIDVSSYNENAADVDRSGDVEIIDATYIMRYAALLNVAYPIGEWITQ